MKKLDNFQDEMILLIRDSFVPAFTALEKTLKEKTEAAGEIGKVQLPAPYNHGIFSASAETAASDVQEGNHRSSLRGSSRGDE